MTRKAITLELWIRRQTSHPHGRRNCEPRFINISNASTSFILRLRAIRASKAAGKKPGLGQTAHIAVTTSMPTLKQLTCCVECELSKTPLQEFQTTYSDGYVETYIAVPGLPTPFSIHLQSNGYIAPGLSMFVYIDGVYQCNRNRQNLKMPGENITKKQTEVNFRVRQKEQMSCIGSFYGKPWKFERVNIGTLTIR